MTLRYDASPEWNPQAESAEQITQELLDRPKAGIYIRTSTKFQGEKGTSLETQSEECITRAENLGHEVDPDCVWTDMESGAFMSRDGLEKMLEAVRTRRVKMVVIHNPDRLGREPVDLLIIARVFNAAEVRLEFVHGPSDRDPEAELVMFILGYVGQKERLQIMERTMRGKEKLAGRAAILSVTELGYSGTTMTGIPRLERLTRKKPRLSDVYSSGHWRA